MTYTQHRQARTQNGKFELVIFRRSKKNILFKQGKGRVVIHRFRGERLGNDWFGVRILKVPGAFKGTGGSSIRVFKLRKVF